MANPNRQPQSKSIAPSAQEEIQVEQEVAPEGEAPKAIVKAAAPAILHSDVLAVAKSFMTQGGYQTLCENSGLLNEAAEAIAVGLSVALTTDAPFIVVTSHEWNGDESTTYGIPGHVLNINARVESRAS